MESSTKEFGLMDYFNETLLKRTSTLKKENISGACVAYWMSRDQRADQNWALVFASQLAKNNKLPLVVFFCVVPEFLNATIRHYGFMLKGLIQVEKALRARDIPLCILIGNPIEEITVFCRDYKVSHLVTDFDPLRIKRQWKKDISKHVECNIYTVDAHNIVPAFLVSGKAEYGAYTLRPKIKKMLPEFLNDFPEPEIQKYTFSSHFPWTNWIEVLNKIHPDNSVPEVDWCLPGEMEAKKVLDNFLNLKLNNYASERNNPVSDATSNLSPYLHFGQISSQYIVKMVLNSDQDTASKEAFLEELIIRRELSDNFCLYNSKYDNFNSFPEWAKKTLNDHRQDRRDFLYIKDQFEMAATHDLLWNAAQTEMVKKGKMHGYMRMYWAKKILEWSASPEDALSIAIYLNDKYELDGRDPNGYAGCAWAIGGTHDRAWNKHPVYGMVRYMNEKGCRRKFNVDAYIKKTVEEKI